MSVVAVSGSFDDLRSHSVRFLQEAARRGPLHVLLWSDDAVAALEGRPPKFPQAERRYFLEAIRYVARVEVVGAVERHALPLPGGTPAVWAIAAADDHEAKRAWCAARGVELQAIPPAELAGFPEPPAAVPSDRPRVIVTGCYDWFHSGHVRFFEEASQLGDLFVTVGHDANIRALKGAGHPLFPAAERRYMVGAVRYVTQALVASGDGWLDAEPEIARIRPHVYAVNEDGDRPEKRAYCAAQGIEYRVLKRTPKEGLPPRQSTALRGF